MREVRQVLDFWFAEANRQHWFRKSPAFDAECRRFEALHERAASVAERVGSSAAFVEAWTRNEIAKAK